MATGRKILVPKTIGRTSVAEDLTLTF